MYSGKLVFSQFIAQFDVKTHLPDFIEITDGKYHDVKLLDQLIPQAGSFYVMDRAYNDFHRLHRFHLLGAVPFCRTILCTKLWSSPSCSKAAGRSSCFSNGSSSTCASRAFSAPRKTPSKHKSDCCLRLCAVGDPARAAESGALIVHFFGHFGNVTI